MSKLFRNAWLFLPQISLIKIPQIAFFAAAVCQWQTTFYSKLYFTHYCLFISLLYFLRVVLFLAQLRHWFYKWTIKAMHSCFTLILHGNTQFQNLQFSPEIILYWRYSDFKGQNQFSISQIFANIRCECHQ